MSDLIVLVGNKDFFLPKSSGLTYTYSIGTGLVHGPHVMSVNNSRRLRAIALKSRDQYSSWIYSLNEIFLRRKLTCCGLSLFLISDCSCKRTELFETYSCICNLLLLKEIIIEKSPNQITLVGSNKHFLSGLTSISQGVPIESVDEEAVVRKSIRRMGSDLRYVVEVALVVLLSAVFTRRNTSKDREPRRYFFSIYPKMMSKEGQDKKYGDFFRSSDRQAVSIVTDGFHQHVSVLTYFRKLLEAKNRNFVVMDEYLRSKDWIRGLYWIFRIRYVLLTESRNYEFQSIDISGWIKDELLQSASRQARFMVIGGAYRRFFKNTPISEFIYYLHEYPLGRLISWLVHVHQPKILTCGFQHGPAAWRKLLYFMSPDETKSNDDYLKQVAIPDKVVAEDKESALIYRHSGYKGVGVMERVHRLSYLENIDPKKEIGTALVAPGLHDGEAMLEIMTEIIKSKRKTEFYLRPHPLAHNRYVSRFRALANLTISEDSIEDLLLRVAMVYVTYSSVGQEAKALGIPVSVVEIPGFFNESPLVDSEDYDNMLINNRLSESHVHCSEIV